ncbi:hypothetical protein [Pseudobacteriovorax antillogorgiicola]|uniref:Uncharacterized protein n=1 Tax=Pseudobacteriovorax antillogorgiicola TaxID=1513793 RepID=A0A1Y6CHB1_9BACT|nr:hypothetical protein [Pseudobacteriovorax antillogorgiicola]TCS47029.1 hypothetical protein EDD56_122124 [Pseudobacteriovorax antillogorgiicola]SMF65279.1 hypothetical protein SAMN06296036_122124 [Pseudobacteriovorax antillogorgiicola]
MSKLILYLSFLVSFAPIASAIDGVKTEIRPRTIYSKANANSFSGSHILVNVFLPKPGSKDLLIEVQNNDRFAVGLFEFDLSTFSRFGSVEWGTIQPKTSKKKLFQIEHTQGLRLADFTVIDADANPRYPNLLVQFIRP